VAGDGGVEGLGEPEAGEVEGGEALGEEGGDFVGGAEEELGVAGEEGEVPGGTGEEAGAGEVVAGDGAGVDLGRAVVLVELDGQVGGGEALEDALDGGRLCNR